MSAVPSPHRAADAIASIFHELDALLGSNVFHDHAEGRDHVNNFSQHLPHPLGLSVKHIRCLRVRVFAARARACTLRKRVREGKGGEGKVGIAVFLL